MRRLLTGYILSQHRNNDFRKEAPPPDPRLRSPDPDNGQLQVLSQAKQVYGLLVGAAELVAHGEPGLVVVYPQSKYDAAGWVMFFNLRIHN